jgi:hypothetical protein
MNTVFTQSAGRSAGGAQHHGRSHLTMAADPAFSTIAALLRRSKARRDAPPLLSLFMAIAIERHFQMCIHTDLL